MENKSIFPKEQKWIIDNLLTLLENQKQEIYLLTQRVTKLEIQNLQLWQKEKDEQSK